MAHHPFSEGRLAKAAAGPESCHVGPNTHLRFYKNSVIQCYDIYLFFFFQYEPPEAQFLTVQTEERHGLHVPETHGQAGFLHHQPPYRHGQIPGADIHRDRYNVTEVNIKFVLQIEISALRTTPVFIFLVLLITVERV